LIKTPY